MAITAPRARYSLKAARLNISPTKNKFFKIVKCGTKSPTLLDANCLRGMNMHMVMTTFTLVYNILFTSASESFWSFRNAKISRPRDR